MGIIYVECVEFANRFIKKKIKSPESKLLAYGSDHVVNHAIFTPSLRLSTQRDDHSPGAVSTVIGHFFASLVKSRIREIMS